MWARMCILEKIPGAFDSYLPPPGINVAWFYEFDGKENDNQVIGFFTAQEISTRENDVYNDGDIKKEVDNNRCFICKKTVPQSQWDKVIPGFIYQGQQLNIPEIHAAVKEEWKPKEKFKIHKFKDKDGNDVEEREELQWEAEVDGDIFNKINEERELKGMGSIQVEKSKIRTVKGEGNKKPTERVQISWIKVIDEIKAEKN
jgi:hypothetical protein